MQPGDDIDLLFAESVSSLIQGLWFLFRWLFSHLSESHLKHEILLDYKVSLDTGLSLKALGWCLFVKFSCVNTINIVLKSLNHPILSHHHIKHWFEKFFVGLGSALTLYFPNHSNYLNLISLFSLDSCHPPTPLLLLIKPCSLLMENCRFTSSCRGPGNQSLEKQCQVNLLW